MPICTTTAWFAHDTMRCKLRQIKGMNIIIETPTYTKVVYYIAPNKYSWGEHKEFSYAVAQAIAGLKGLFI